MQRNDENSGNSLLVVISEKGKGSEILNFAVGLGIRGATAFRARGTVPGKLLRLLELVDVRKDIIMIALPTKDEAAAVEQLTQRFNFDRQKKGIIFTLSLSAVFGSSHFNPQPTKRLHSLTASPFQAVMTIVDKGKTDDILDFVEQHGFPRGTVIDAHGSADKSRHILNLMLEKEKEIFLIITTRQKAQALAKLLYEYLNLGTDNSGVLAILNIRQLAGAAFGLREEETQEDSLPVVPDEQRCGHSAIFAIVENNKDEAVIHSAESAGSTGATVIHARGSRSYHNNFLSHGVEPEREVIIIIAENEKVPGICKRINADLSLEQSGKGILLVAPLYDTMGLRTPPPAP